MSYDNSGILFKNDRKQTEKHPDYTGSITINGIEHWLSAWIKKGQKGSFMSLSIGDVKEKQAQKPQERQQPEPDFDDQIPF